MIENIRRYTGLIFVVIVLLLLGFIFMDTSTFRQSGGGGTFVTVGKRGYTQSEFVKLGQAPIQLLQAMPDYAFFGFYNALRGDATQEENQEVQFFAGRMVIREAREEFGVHPSDDEVNTFIRNLRFFQTSPPIGAAPGTPGEFDQARYNEFIQKRIGGFGMNERDFQELVRDVIATETLRELIGGGLTGSRHIAKAMAVVRAQQIEASVASIELEPFREKIQPTDEELKTYWETRKEAYQTEKRVQISYILAAPTYPEDAIEKPEEADATEKTPDEQAAADKAKQERADKRAKAEKDLTIAIDGFINRVQDTDGKEFEKAIEENGWKLITTDWFTQSTIPEELNLTARASSAGKSVSGEIFGLTLGGDDLAAFTDAIAVGEHQWLVARLDEAEEVREKKFEEAKEQVKDQYVAEKLKEAAEAEVEAKTEALKKAMESGKTFEEAAKDLGLEPRKLGPWGASDSLDNEFSAREIFQLASTTNPGEFAEPLYQEDRAVIIHVDKREIIKDDNRGQQVDSYASNLEVRNETAAFAAWVNQAVRNANVKLANVR